MRLLPVGLVLVAACGSPPVAMLDGGLSDAAIEVCLEPDRECPGSGPFPGSPCEGTLSCAYTGGTATCVAGEWAWQSACDAGGACDPPLVESCAEPFAGSLGAATVAIGPDEPGPFRPFASGEHVAPIRGPEGRSMLAYRLRVSAPGGTPVCVETETSLEHAGMPTFRLPGTVELHCGQTLRVYTILPTQPCESGELPVGLSVEVAGVGRAAVPLVVDGGPCD